MFKYFKGPGCILLDVNDSSKCFRCTFSSIMASWFSSFLVSHFLKQISQEFRFQDSTVLDPTPCGLQLLAHGCNLWNRHHLVFPFLTTLLMFRTSASRWQISRVWGRLKTRSETRDLDSFALLLRTRLHLEFRPCLVGLPFMCLLFTLQFIGKQCWAAGCKSMLGMTQNRKWKKKPTNTQQCRTKWSKFLLKSIPKIRQDPACANWVFST